MIYSELSFDDFVREFKECGREDNFSIDGLEALYNFLWGFAEDFNTPYVLDVIALCCDFSEYSLEEAVGTFHDLLQGLYTVDEVLDELNNHTTAFKTASADTIVVANF